MAYCIAQPSDKRTKKLDATPKEPLHESYGLLCSISSLLLIIQKASINPNHLFVHHPSLNFVV